MEKALTKWSEYGKKLAIKVSNKVHLRAQENRYVQRRNESLVQC